jgi:hypothetical protein
MQPPRAGRSLVRSSSRPLRNSDGQGRTGEFDAGKEPSSDVASRDEQERGDLEEGVSDVVEEPEPSVLS